MLLNAGMWLVLYPIIGIVGLFLLLYFIREVNKYHMTSPPAEAGFLLLGSFLYFCSHTITIIMNLDSIQYFIELDFNAIQYIDLLYDCILKTKSEECGVFVSFVLVVFLLPIFLGIKLFFLNFRT